MHSMKHTTEKIQQTWPIRNGRTGNDGNSAGGKAIQDTLITQHASWGPHVRPHIHSQDGLSDILKCIATQDPAPHLACARSGYKRRSAEPSTSLISSECSDKLRKAMKRDGKFIRGNLHKISRTSFKIPSKVRTNFRSQIDTSGINKTWVNQYKQLMIKNWEVFSLHTYDLGDEPLKIKEIQQERIKSVHERKKEKSLWENTAMTLAATFNINITLFIPPQNSSIIKNYFLNLGKKQNLAQMHFNSPMNICCPILKNTNISPYHGILTPVKFNIKMFINKLSGRTYLKSNLLKRKATFHDYGYKGTNISRTIRNILHRFIKKKESTYSHTILTHINGEMTTQKTNNAKLR